MNVAEEFQVQVEHLYDMIESSVSIYVEEAKEEHKGKDEPTDDWLRDGLEDAVHDDYDVSEAMDVLVATMIESAFGQEVG